MSAILDSLKKIEQKEKPGDFDSSGIGALIQRKSPSAAFQKWFAFLLVTFAATFTIFAYFASLKYQELGRALVSQGTRFNELLDDFSSRIDEIGENLRSTNANYETVTDKVGSLSKQLERERDVQTKLMTGQTTLIHQTKTSIENQFNQRFNVLAGRISVLEASAKVSPPPEEQFRKSS